MNIVSLLNERTILPNLEVTNKNEILDRLISTFNEELSEEELEKIRAAIMERENIMSTGVGKGLAIPHGKTTGIEKTYAAFAVLKNSIDYGAIDDEPVNMVFMLAGPQSSNSFHIKMLSRISRLMNKSDFRQHLLECRTTEEIIEQFKQEEHVTFDE